MSSYVAVDDQDFYSFINRRYAKYKIPAKQKTFQQICFPPKYELQIPQRFLADFINPKTPYKGILVYYGIGSGKTCTAISIAEKFIKHKHIIFVLPAFLKGNLRAELRTLCAGEKYLIDSERAKLKNLDPTDAAYKEIIYESNKRIDKNYTIYSYNKFVDLLQKSTIKLDDSLLIIDEVHNMISETGIYYETLYKAVHSAADTMRLVIMTATPIFDKPAEIALTMNLLLHKKRQLPSGSDFYHKFIDIKYTARGPVYRVKNMSLFKKYIKGYISYYRGAPPYVYPRSELHFAKCKMSDIQYRLYKQVVKTDMASDVEDFIAANISNSFFVGTRMISNFVYPNKAVGPKGYESLKDSDLTIANIREYSPKFLKILRRIKRCDGTVFFYSNFKEFGGIKPFIRLLEHHRFKNYETGGSGPKRFAVWSGDTDPIMKDEIKAVFNNKNNEDGTRIKVILVSPSGKEGVSFYRVQEVHILEPYWNWSRLSQVIGRAIRFCSHKDVAPEKQLVKVYIYLATHPKLKMSVDEKIMKMAIQKQLINIQFEKAIKEAAIDCTLFENANVITEADKLECET